MNSHPKSEPQRDDDRALFTCSLWLHTGYVGAVVVAAGLIELLAGEASALPGIALAVSGGVLTAASWRRARAVLERAENGGHEGERGSNRRETQSSGHGIALGSLGTGVSERR